MKLVRGEVVSPLEWTVYMGAGLGAGLLLWFLASRMYLREKLAVSA